MLFVACCLLDCRLLRAVWRSAFSVCRSLFVVRCSFVVGCWLFAVHGVSPFVVCCGLLVVCCLAFVVCCFVFLCGSVIICRCVLFVVC